MRRGGWIMLSTKSQNLSISTLKILSYFAIYDIKIHQRDEFFNVNYDGTL